MITIKNILCPVDFFAASQRALEYSIGVARNYQATLHILHVVSPGHADVLRVLTE